MPLEPPQHWTGRYATSIAALERRQWNACFDNPIEGYDYHRGVEASGIADFELGWYAIEAGSELVCAAPVFQTRYDLSTTAQGRVRDMLERAKRFVPGQLSLGLSCLGSPVTEMCQIGFSPNLDEAQRLAALSALITRWTKDAHQRGIYLQGLKDLSSADHERYGPALKAANFRFVTSMPSTTLAIDFADIASYLGHLSAGTRKDMRRKLKSRAEIRVETCSDITAFTGPILEMYRETRARSDWAFEDLPASYFTQVLAADPNAVFKLYFCGDTLVAANLLLCDGRTLLDKFFVMRGDEGRRLNLYFLSWFENITHCLQHKLAHYHSGQAGYETKLRLGSSLHPSWMGFRHRNPVLHAVLKLAAPLLSVEQPAVKSKAAGEGER